MGRSPRRAEREKRRRVCLSVSVFFSWRPAMIRFILLQNRAGKVSTTPRTPACQRRRGDPRRKGGNAVSPIAHRARGRGAFFLPSAPPSLSPSPLHAACVPSASPPRRAGETTRTATPKTAVLFTPPSPPLLRFSPDPPRQVLHPRRRRRQARPGVRRPPRHRGAGPGVRGGVRLQGRQARLPPLRGALLHPLRGRGGRGAAADGGDPPVCGGKGREGGGGGIVFFIGGVSAFVAPPQIIPPLPPRAPFFSIFRFWTTTLATCASWTWCSTSTRWGRESGKRGGVFWF